MDLRKIVFHHRPNVAFITASGVLSLFAQRPTPSLIPGVLTLATLLVYSRILFHSQYAVRNSVFLWITLTIAGALPRLFASLHALSTIGVSLLVLFSLSSITSLITICALYIDTKTCMRMSTSWSRITFFPALWMTTWILVSYASPIGRLSAWSPMEGTGAYGWIIQFVGSAGYDWVVAAWAVLCSQAIGAWLIGPEAISEDELVSLDDTVDQQRSSSRIGHSQLLMTIILSALTIPSFVMDELPLPVTPSEATPLTMGCILPSSQQYGHSPTIDDYIAESRKLTVARILVWPEGAVSFKSETERDEGLERVRNEITGSHVAVSFEESFSTHGSNGRSNSKRTGLALVSQSSPTPHLVYYKRHLVPIAESFSLTHSIIPPSIYTLDLSYPNYMKKNKTNWAPGPDHTRPIPLTSSICLDFAMPSAFNDLESRPALILAPARTWHHSVGYAMWLQAKQRAEEIGSMVLWCDGGDGGVSGIAGGGHTEVMQVGSGSWVRTIGVQYPFNKRRTPYVYLGEFPLVFFWALVFMGPLNQIDLRPMRSRVWGYMTRWRNTGADKDVRQRELEGGNEPAVNLFD